MFLRFSLANNAFQVSLCLYLSVPNIKEDDDGDDFADRKKMHKETMTFSELIKACMEKRRTCSLIAPSVQFCPILFLDFMNADSFHFVAPLGQLCLLSRRRPRQLHAGTSPGQGSGGEVRIWEIGPMGNFKIE